MTAERRSASAISRERSAVNRDQQTSGFVRFLAGIVVSVKSQSALDVPT